MNASQLKNFRHSILLVLDTSAGQRRGLTAEAIALHVRRFGFSPTPAEVERELQYLTGEPLRHVELVDPREFSPEVRAWRITTRGMNFLALENE